MNLFYKESKSEILKYIFGGGGGGGGRVNDLEKKESKLKNGGGGGGGRGERTRVREFFLLRIQI